MRDQAHIHVRRLSLSSRFSSSTCKHACQSCGIASTRPLPTAVRAWRSLDLPKRTEYVAVANAARAARTDSARTCAERSGAAAAASVLQDCSGGTGRPLRRRLWCHHRCVRAAVVCPPAGRLLSSAQAALSSRPSSTGRSPPSWRTSDPSTTSRTSRFARPFLTPRCVVASLGKRDAHLRNSLPCAQATRPSLFVTEISFELLVKLQIQRLRQPSVQVCGGGGR